MKKSHCDPDDYLDKYEAFETKATYLVCKCCDKKIKRHFSSIRNHLSSEHELTIEAYQKKFCVAVEYEVTVDGPIGHEEVSIAEIPVLGDCSYHYITLFSYTSSATFFKVVKSRLNFFISSVSF